jgi:hypothetical protein
MNRIFGVFILITFVMGVGITSSDAWGRRLEHRNCSERIFHNAMTWDTSAVAGYNCQLKDGNGFVFTPDLCECFYVEGLTALPFPTFNAQIQNAGFFEGVEQACTCDDNGRGTNFQCVSENSGGDTYMKTGWVSYYGSNILEQGASRGGVATPFKGKCERDSFCTEYCACEIFEYDSCAIGD